MALVLAVQTDMGKGGVARAGAKEMGSRWLATCPPEPRQHSKGAANYFESKRSTKTKTAKQPDEWQDASSLRHFRGSSRGRRWHNHCDQDRLVGRWCRRRWWHRAAYLLVTVVYVHRFLNDFGSRNLHALFQTPSVSHFAIDVEFLILGNFELLLGAVVERENHTVWRGNMPYFARYLFGSGH